MANPKNGGVNKSAAIREAIGQNPKGKPKEIVATLAGRGVKVAPSLVYYIKSKGRQAKRKQKRAQVAGAAARTPHANPVELVIRVKDMAREVGGIHNLKMLVDLLAE